MVAVRLGVFLDEVAVLVGQRLPEFLAMDLFSHIIETFFLN